MGDITFVGTFGIPDRNAWVPAITHMIDHVARQVPRLASFHAYADADFGEGTVVYVHPDADSLDQHLVAAADLIEAGNRMVAVRRIQLLGSPHPATVERIRAAAGDAVALSLKPHVLGFDRHTSSPVSDFGDRVVFMGSFTIPDRDAWIPAVTRMSDFVEANVPRVASFHAYADATEGTVVHVHPDADSFDQQLAAAAELIRSGNQMVSVTRIDLLGSPHPATLERMRTRWPVRAKQHVYGFEQGTARTS